MEYADHLIIHSEDASLWMFVIMKQYLIHNKCSCIILHGIVSGVNSNILIKVWCDGNNILNLTKAVAPRCSIMNLTGWPLGRVCLLYCKNRFAIFITKYNLTTGCCLQLPR